MRLTDINTVKELLSKNGFSFSKSLGQNFLINPSVCPRIAELGTEAGSYAVEIGTGIGVLTKELAMRCRKVVAIEIDERLKPVLEETLSGFDNIEVVFADVLSVDLSALIKNKFPPGACISCCANLPYYITSPVIMKLLEERLPLQAVTVMVQKEAAERICAAPGTRECGAVSAAVRYYSRPEKLFNVSRGSFLPAPNVDSAVIRLSVYGETPYRVTDEELFFKIVKSVFSQRRKQAANPLSETFGINKEDLRNIFAGGGINPAARAEEFKMDDLVYVCEALKGALC